MLRNRKRFKLLWVGKTKEKFVAEGILNYVERIKPFADIEIISIKEEKGRDVVSGMRRETDRIMKSADSFILLHNRGRLLTSEEFATFLGERKETSFLIGGPYGVSPEIEKRAEMTLSLSPMTFTHELARIFLVEQIYRAMTIMKGMRYHH
jgi:23S rRNA (pseudouridine1915-N3)-methyltransferase